MNEVLAAIVMKSSVVWNVTLHSPSESLVAAHADFLLASFFSPEDGGDIHLRNVC
jgi:hypothetical protein